MADLDWSKCEAVESVAGKVSGAWVFKGTRMPVSTVFENMEAGASVQDVTEWFHVAKEEVLSVLAFVVQSLQYPPNLNKPAAELPELVDTHSV